MQSCSQRWGHRSDVRTGASATDVFILDCVSTGVLQRTYYFTKYRCQFTRCLVIGRYLQNDPNVCVLKARAGQGWRPSSDCLQEAPPGVGGVPGPSITVSWETLGRRSIRGPH